MNGSTSVCQFAKTRRAIKNGFDARPDIIRIHVKSSSDNEITSYPLEYNTCLIIWIICSFHFMPVLMVYNFCCREMRWLQQSISKESIYVCIFYPEIIGRPALIKPSC